MTRFGVGFIWLDKETGKFGASGELDAYFFGLVKINWSKFEMLADYCYWRPDGN